MKKVFLTIALVISQFGMSQLQVGVGVFGGNQDNDNPINLKELREWDGFQSGVALGEWMTESQMDEFIDRTDGTLEGLNFNIGYSLPLINYVQQGTDSQFGISARFDAFYQNKNLGYKNFASTISAGLYVDFGLRIEAGVQKFHDNFNWYLDLSAQIIGGRDRSGSGLYLYTKYNRENPFDSEITSIFHDGSGITMETLNAGLRFKF